jgi:purine-binding chemotaxis protein CheW
MSSLPVMTGQNKKLLVFSLQGSLYALYLKQVAEVIDPPHLSPIPLAPACYSGALNFHGNIVAVMNLALFLGLAGNIPPGKVIALHQDVASLAFLVDSVIRIVSEEEVTFHALADNRFAVSSLQLQEGEAILLDLEALVLEAEFSMQKAG